MAVLVSASASMAPTMEKGMENITTNGSVQLLYSTTIDRYISISDSMSAVVRTLMESLIFNVPILKRVLQGPMVLEGMVPFNVATQEAGHYHQGTSGALSVKQYPNQNLLENAFQKAGLEIVFEKDMLAVQWAKLLLNLNNSINALSKKPLKEQLSIRKYRQCVAMAQQEALELLDCAQIKPAKLTVVPTHLIPKLLSLPNPLFKLLSRKMLAIDPLARSSMQDDLIAGRPTEVDWINGEVLKLAEQCGRRAPINARLIELIKQAEKSSPSFSMSADTLKDQLKSAAKQ